jgi:hypothetical protein
VAAYDKARACNANAVRGGDMTKRMTQIVFPPLLGFVTCGLVLSLAVHLGSLAGLRPPGGNVLFGGLFAGVFQLVLALIFISRTQPELAFGKTDKWKLPVYPECPAWMHHMTRAFYAYAFVVFAVFVVANFLSTGTVSFTMHHSFSAGDPSIASWRGFSSMWLMFYSMSLAELTTAYRTCTNRHGGPGPDAKARSQSEDRCGSPTVASS